MRLRPQQAHERKWSGILAITFNWQQSVLRRHEKTRFFRRAKQNVRLVRPVLVYFDDPPTSALRDRPKTIKTQCDCVLSR